MEEYLQYMRTLRSQMNDVEDQATKVSVDEQMLITTAQTLDNDLTSVRSRTKQLKEDADQMMKAKGNICSQILEKQRRIASLESDVANLSQTLELIQQEKAGLASKVVEKRNYYAKVADEASSKFVELQDWVRARITNGRVADNQLMFQQLGGDTRHELSTQLDTAKTKLAELEEMKSKLAAENSELKQSIEQVKCEARDFKPDLLTMEIKTLEGEYEALLADKEGETEFLRSLQDQIKKLQGISHMINCACGMEYKVVMDFCK